MKHFYQQLSQALLSLCEELFEVSPQLPVLEIPRESKFGDFATSLPLRLASQLKKSPQEIAQKLIDALPAKINADIIENLQAHQSGFINIFISPRSLRGAMKLLLENKENFFREQRKRKVLIEFVSANPTGPLSIAHGRQAVAGDIIANILEFMGNEVIREYYINDEGRQITLLVESVSERMKELKGEEFSIPEGGYQGEYVRNIAEEVIKKNPSDLCSFVIEEMLALIKKDLTSLGVQFDNWVSQRKLIAEGKIKKALSDLKGASCIYEKEKALWFSSTKFADDKDRVLQKSDGEFTYFASDIAYHREKYKRGYDQLINLWGPDHHGYIARVKAACRAFGFDETMLNIRIIQLVTIKTKERMSRRKGTAILLSDLIDDVGKDAARFYYLVRRTSSPLDFDIDLAKKASYDNPLYYIQYAHARIFSVFHKAGTVNISPECTHSLHDEEEFLLMRKIFQFFYSLDKAYYSLEPLFIIDYLRELAGAFHQFYERKKVLCDDAKVRMARLGLLEAVRSVIACGLNLLGIEAPKKM